MYLYAIAQLATGITVFITISSILLSGFSGKIIQQSTPIVASLLCALYGDELELFSESV